MTYQSESARSYRVFWGKLSANSRLFVNYAGAYLLLSIVLGSVAMMHTGIPIIMQIIQLLAFLILGYVNTSSIEMLSPLSKYFFIEKAVFTLMLGLLVCLALSAIYYVTNTNMRMAFASTSAFLVPFLILHAWFFYKHIPKNSEWDWNKADFVADELAQSFHNKISVRFRLSDHYFDLKEKEYFLPVSTSIKLGILFNQFLISRQSEAGTEIEIQDEQQQPFGWQFFAESMGGLRSRQLNPELNIRENRLHRSEYIAVRRLYLMPTVEENQSPDFEFEAW